MTDAPEVLAFLARTDPTRVRRMDVTPADAIGRAFTVSGQRPFATDWHAFAVANAADPACAGDPLGMTVVRKDEATTITVYWAAAT